MTFTSHFQGSSPQEALYTPAEWQKLRVPLANGALSPCIQPQHHQLPTDNWSTCDSHQPYMTLHHYLRPQVTQGLALPCGQLFKDLGLGWSSMMESLRSVHQVPGTLKAKSGHPHLSFMAQG